jgi:hypothetical protein
MSADKTTKTKKGQRTKEITAAEQRLVDAEIAAVSDPGDGDARTKLREAEAELARLYREQGVEETRYSAALARLGVIDVERAHLVGVRGARDLFAAELDHREADIWDEIGTAATTRFALVDMAHAGAA